jgi:hypothetical protein
MRLPIFAFVAFLAALTGQAAALETPKGQVILTVSGAISQTNGPNVASFDRGMLDNLPKRLTRIETPWTKGMVAFEGPLGAALLDAVGAKGTTLKVVALNDYAAEIPVEDFRKWPVILATTKDGAEMPVRDKGPIFVIYPFDQDPGLYNERYFNRSVWQVKSIEVR